MSADEDGGHDGSDDGAEKIERPAARQEWRTAADARLLDRLSAHDTRGERLARAWTMPSRVRPVRRLLDPADWRTGFLRVEGERDIPHALQTDLHENAPQSLLRDLYRPVREETWVEREIVEGTGDRGGHGAMQAVREARHLPALPRVEPGVRAVVAYQAWRRELVAERWRPIRKEPADKP